MAERINQRENPLIGRNIVRLRKREKLRPADVLTELKKYQIEMRSGTFSKIENGGNNPSVELLIALTEILHCDFNDFFADEGSLISDPRTA